ncbi:MAG TPA: purine-nucleoside phosphorylase [Dokdonella sp.]|uniref:purine-nucleoside phosphorylase n=1 Tax=Dokdonella sp. TaxID=2291710 RepID=UPI002D7EA24A|nr:purine-nucleoside phosphorylase [Dokdonella sp.]HET9031440.1 purine-nucleoside phosphorylase [Dokdonella sp.]
MNTPHIAAEIGSIAATVLLPGDPLRARHIATQFFDNCIEVNTRRNMLAFTGTYRGEPVTAMGSGMGIPSCAIYATELARVYAVKRIARIGTCGGIGDVAMGDLLLAQSASTDSNFNRLHFGGHDLSACADFELMCAVRAQAQRSNRSVRVAHVFSTDCFYAGDTDILPLLARHRICGIEMESAGLYAVAMRENIQALSLLTMTDHLERDEHMPADQRERGLAQAAELVLDSLLKADTDAQDSGRTKA